VSDNHPTGDIRSTFEKVAYTRHRLQHLYEISKLLNRFESAERTVPAVVALMARTLPLRSAILILETASRPSQTLVWPIGEVDADRLRAAQVHTEAAYAQLSGPAARSDSAPHPETGNGERPGPTEADKHQNFIILPLVVGHQSIFGALQLECTGRPQEPDLLFANAVINQLAVALDRQAVIDASQAATETKQARAEERGKVLLEADRRKNEFLAMLAHELRNPLAPIANAVHLLGLEKSEGAIQQQARAVIERQTGRLARLVDDLLEVSRITSGKIHLNLERISFGGIVERAVESVRPLIDQRRHTLTVALPPQPVWLWADTARLEQVVINLLTNAAKYTDEGGQIGVTVQQEREDAVLRVRDTGSGIDPELLPRVFDLFTQADRSLDRSQGGLGIGLSLVHRLVAMHAGTVKVESVLGQGSEFTVRLPVSTALPEPAVPLVPASRPAAQRLRVLVVDDNVDTAESLAMLLQALGHTVWTAYRGLTALEVAREHRPQVVFLDIGLPELDGYEVAKRMRQQPALRDVTLIAMTGYGQAEDRQHSHEVGFDHHLVKPADFARMEGILEKLPKK
jgi:signal transduction histidine kinase/CheY-like chemotaxis protein